jgi:predicted molibdopterin-dependent oxidoreductase YjgC
MEHGTMKRIIEHPILGKEEKREGIKIIVNGKSMYAHKGETIAAALIANGYRDFRYTHRFNLPRGFFCGIGQCTDCSMIVNGVPNIRTCVTRVEEGMIIETQYGYGDKDKKNEGS